MTFQFDELIRRENTNSYKWDKYSGDVIPLWVADMDFTGAPAIREALHQLAEFNVIGYSRTPDELVDVICQRLQDKHHWEIQPEWIVWLPGMIPGLHAASSVLCARDGPGLADQGAGTAAGGGLTAPPCRA